MLRLEKVMKSAVAASISVAVTFEDGVWVLQLQRPGYAASVARFGAFPLEAQISAAVWQYIQADFVRQQGLFDEKAIM